MGRAQRAAMKGWSASSASLLMVQCWVEWVTLQNAMLPSRESWAGWRGAGRNLMRINENKSLGRNNCMHQEAPGRPMWPSST